MKVYNPHQGQVLPSTLWKHLERYRTRFPETRVYIEAKAQILHQYMLQTHRDTCVVAVSGGIDSAVVLALACYAKSLKNSPIRQMVALALPVFSSSATHQDRACEQAQAVCERFGVKLTVVDLTSPHAVLEEACRGALQAPLDPWAAGQLVSYLRTPSIYYTTSLLTAQGYRPVVLGTTNRDEGAYIGYFGKASDGMVDVQMLSDAHKHNVRQVAKALGVPQRILSVVPTGDMYDGREDEEVFGAPYAFVELYTMYLEYSVDRRKAFLEALPTEDAEVFAAMAKNIENMHRYNGHKYLGASPAVHLDVVPSQFAEGWTYKTFSHGLELPTEGNHERW